MSLRWRAAATAKQVEALAPAGENGMPRVVHAFGGQAWGMAQALADRLDAALVVEVWRAGLGRAVQRLVAQNRGRPGLLALCPTEGLAEELGAEVSGIGVRCAPWGVYTEGKLRSVLRPGKAWSIMLAGAGMDKAAFASCFEAISDVIRSRPDALVFADALAARRTGLWQLAARLGVRERLSLVDEMDANRELVLKGDVLVLPEARGEQRTLTLEAMGVGMPIVALADPTNTILLDRRSALIAKTPDRAAWTGQFEALLGDARVRNELTTSARAYVGDVHRPSRQVNRVMDAYEAAAGKQPIPFPG